MRKTLLVITVLLVATQAYAGTVTMSVDDEGGHWAAIRYSADANVSAFGLKVTADSEAIFTHINDYNVGECTASVQGYGIFPGTIDINELTALVDYNGTPVAPNDDPGATGTGFGTGTLVLEMGALYVEGNEPALSGTLIKVKVDSDCNVCVSGEPVRGNVVFTDATFVDPCEACEYIMVVVVVCTVPDVVGDPNGDAQTEITTEGFVVGDITTAYSDTVPYDHVISTDPIAGATPGCDTAVDIEVSEGSDCYLGQPDEDEWIAAGRPICWCYPRQCHGDADGIRHGTGGYLGYWWVGQSDLEIMAVGWMEKNPPKGSGILNRFVAGRALACADFGHELHGTGGYLGYWRIGQSDLEEMALYWLEKEPPKGSGTPADCQPGNRTP